MGKTSFFHLMMFPGETPPVDSTVMTVDGLDVRCLIAPPTPISDAFGLSFEEAVRRLNDLDRMFIELDGSFVWVCKSNGDEAQVDGLLNDLNDRVISVELKGTDYSSLDRLFTIFGWPEQPIMIQDVRRGLFFEEAEFRRFHKYLSSD